MIKIFKILIPLTLMFTAHFCFGQEDYQVKTLFGHSGQRASGGFGAIGNKFTTIKGEFANMTEIYGGWYINHKFLLGASGASVTSNLRVPAEFSTSPGMDMSYAYVQFGSMMEYVLWSSRAIHFSIHAFNGPGFTAQYWRNQWGSDEIDDFDDYSHDSNWFFVTEPGVTVEFNLLQWMRFSPGVSYRAAFGSRARGLSDADLSGACINLTMKFGKF